MPGQVTDGPSVALSFANNFWGKDDAGVIPLMDRMHNAKISCDELKSFYSTRAAIEDEYARKLLALCRKPLGSCETGTLRVSLDVVRGETESIAKAHSAIASQMKSELEEPLAAFAGGMKERRKIVQSGIEKLLKSKTQQTHTVNKAKDRYEQDCLRIKGYLAQGHMVMGQEERKNKAKLEKTQIQLASNSSEYEVSIKVLEETTGRWNKEWKAACDKFQDLEEERLDFTKSSLWSYANIASTVCVSDDASCEKIRLSLENCEVEKDIGTFIKDRGTGQEIPDPPRFINFCRGDVNDTNSEVSDEDNYSVAQFQRPINPAFRSSSPQPSTFESHHDPHLESTTQLGHETSSGQPSREVAVTPQKVPVDVAQPAPLDLRRGVQLPPNYSPSQHGEIASVPHNAYPPDGMTMLCRTGPPSERSSALSCRPSSRDSQSDISNPTSFSSQEPPSGKQSPVKPPTNGVPMPGMSSDKQVQKKRSTFFSNSPFRRKSRSEKDRQSVYGQPVKRSGWDSSNNTSPTKRQGQLSSQPDRRSGSPEPVDPRANFQLNIGNNVFDVASPDNKRALAGKDDDDLDPIARALADLKGVGKQSTSRVSADRYHGIATPAPSNSGSNYGQGQRAAGEVAPPSYNDASVSRLDAPQPAFTSAQMQKTTQKYVGKTQNMFGGSNTALRGGRGTARGQDVPRDRPSLPRDRSPVPRDRSSVPRDQSPAPRDRSPAPRDRSSVPRDRSPAPRDRSPIPRARSPAPTVRRSASPQPAPRVDNRAGQPNGGSLQNNINYQSNSFNNRYQQSPTSFARPGSDRPGSDRGYSPQNYSRHGSPNEIVRAVSPQPQFMQQHRPSSSGGMELQLSQVDPYAGVSYDSYGGRSREGSRPVSMYHGNGPEAPPRARSKSIAALDRVRQFSRDGRPILHFARAMYSYTAAIPEELGFSKGDILAVLRLQDDGWWEAEVTSGHGRPGLVPSNYLQNL